MNLNGNTYVDNKYQGTLVEGGKINEDTIWGNSGDESIIIVTGNIEVYGETNVTLTIEPGAEIQFEPGAGLYVGYFNSSPGSLYAKGTESSPIRFTSNLPSPAPGSWKGIYFKAATVDSGSLLEHCIVEYAGETHNTNIYCENAYPPINNCTLRYSSGYPIRVEPKKMNLSGNTYVDNKYQGTLIEGGTIDENTTWGNNGDEATIIVTGDINIYEQTGSKLTINSGVEVRFDPGTGIYVGYFASSPGSLYAKGTELSPIKFTSNLSSPIPGSWKGIYFKPATVGSQTLLEYCIIEYGGESHKSNIYMENASPTIQYNTIRESSSAGIRMMYSGSAQTVVDCNNFTSNKVGLFVDRAAPQITNNNFENNEIGLFNNSSTAVDAANNWWNDPAGPNAGGDTVSGTVTVDPWLAERSNCSSATAPAIAVTPETATVTAEGGTADFNVAVSGSTSIDWTATENAGWFSISPGSGTNNGTITATYDANTGAERTGTITVTASGGAEPVTVTIVQETAETPACDAAAAFTADTSDGLTVTFGTTGSTGTLSFDYGDNATGTEPSHTYAAPGTYTVTLTATVSDTCSDTMTADITVSDPCSASAGFTAVSEGMQAVFDTSRTEGTLSFEYGDGSTGAEPSHTYAAAGTYTVTLTATVSDTCSDTKTATVTITEPTVPLLPPGNLDARSGENSIRLTWEPSNSTYLEGYNIYRSTTESGPWTLLNETAPVTGDTFTDTAQLADGTTSYYHVKSVDTSGVESDPSEIAAAVWGQLKLFIPDANGNNGDEVTIPVNIGNADGLELCASDISVSYDPGVLSIKGISKTPLSVELGASFNLEGEPGLAIAAIASAESSGTLYGEGSLLFFTFDVIGNAGETSPLNFEVDGANATDIYECSDLYNEITVEMFNGTFTVKDTCILGDVNGNGTVDAADAALALEIATRKVTPDECQMIAGEVSGDGRILANDAALILRLASGLPLTPATSANRRMALRASPINVSVPGNASVFEGGSIYIPVSINDAAELASAQIVLNYDSNLLSVEEVIKAALTEDFDIDFDKSKQGQITVNIANDQAITTGSGELIKIKFTAVQDVSGNQNSPLTLAGVHLYDSFGRDFVTSALQKEVTTTDGRLTVSEIGSLDLGNVILILKVLSGLDIGTAALNLDVDNNTRVELQDALYILQYVANLRTP